MDNKMRLEFLAKSENEGFARVSVSAFIAQLDPTIEELTDIKTAVSEAVTNAIIHGYECDESKVVIIEASICEDEISITVEDNGKFRRSKRTLIYIKTRIREIRYGIYCYGNIHGFFRSL